MTALIVTRNAEEYAAKMDAIGQRLREDPARAAALAAMLLCEPACACADWSEIRNEFERLPPWEKAGAIDELRNAIDHHLGDLFLRYMNGARVADEERASTQTNSTGG